MHTPCLSGEKCVRMAVGDSPGQVSQCQKSAAPLPAWLLGRGSLPGTKLLFPSMLGKNPLCRALAPVCGSWGAGSCFQQPMHCSAYAFDSPHLLLNTSLAEMPGSCCNYLPNPFRCSFPACWICEGKPVPACTQPYASHPEVWPYRWVT